MPNLLAFNYLNSEWLSTRLKCISASKSFSFFWWIAFFVFAFASPLALFAQQGKISGSVVNSLTNEPIMFANVLLLGTDIGASTDLDGKFVLENLSPGFYDIRVSYLGFRERVVSEVQVTSARPVELEIRLEESGLQLEEVVVQASPFRRTEESPVSLRNIGVAEIQRNPGANRDISLVVQSLPGVTSTASFRNDLLIRGGGPNENRFYLDDVEVPVINHFATQGASGGPAGIINVDFIREVDFYSGAFPANRGNALSSVFQFNQKDGRSDRFGLTATLGASDAGVTLEGPIGKQKKTTYLFSVRRSYLQFLFRAFDLPFLPTYTDVQFKVKTRFDQKNELTIIGLGAIDQFSLNLDANESEYQRYLLANLPVNEQYNYTRGVVYKRFDDKGYTTFVLSRNKLNNDATKYIDNDDSDPENALLLYNSVETENKARVERVTRTGGWKWLYGAGYEFARYTNSTFNRINTPAGNETIDYESKLDMHKYAAFLQVSRSFVQERLVISGGFRVDGNDYSSSMQNPLNQISPRLSASYELTPKLSVSANAGIFYQLPPYTILGFEQENQAVNRNRTDYIRADHLVAGIEYLLPTNTKFSFETYVKRYSQYPFLLRDSLNLANIGGDFGVVGNEPAASIATGRTYGFEVLVQQRLYKGFYGILAYTLGWSEFSDRNEQFVPSSWDARHIVNLTAGKRFGKDWEAGVNVRYQSGLPFTPFDEARSARVENWQINNMAVRDYSQLNTLRLGPVFAVDARIDKKWNFPKWSLNLYFDIQNLTGTTLDERILILDTDEAGNPRMNPDAPGSYLLKELRNDLGVTIPSLGVVVSF